MQRTSKARAKKLLHRRPKEKEVRSLKPAGTTRTRSYTKAEIRFWWNPRDEAIHVTTRPGSTRRPLATTFPNDESSERWHRSFFAWLVGMLEAEGKPAPPVSNGAAHPATYPIRLSGEMWWNDPAKPGRLDEFLLFEDRLTFVVTDIEYGGCYRGSLSHGEAGRNRYGGPLSFQGGAGNAVCELTEGPDGTYRLKGKWSQSNTSETFDWNAELERESDSSRSQIA